MCSKIGIVSVGRTYIGYRMLYLRGVLINENLIFVDAGNFERACPFELLFFSVEKIFVAEF